MRFSETVKRLPGLVGVPEQDELRRLPQFFRADADMVWKLGGSVYRDVLRAVPLQGKRRFVSIDSRLHMLMPGWLPCIGGWHCDDFYRPRPTPGAAISQPDLRGIANDKRLQCEHHSVALGELCPTEFIAEPLDLSPELLDSPTLYRTCHAVIERKAPTTLFAASGEVISFGSLDFHRGTTSTGSGWRLFVRVTESDIWEPKNELRTQTQVYIESAAAGW